MYAALNKIQCYSEYLYGPLHITLQQAFGSSSLIFQDPLVCSPEKRKLMLETYSSREGTIPCLKQMRKDLCMTHIEGFVLSWCMVSVIRAVTHNCSSQEDTWGGGRARIRRRGDTRRVIPNSRELRHWRVLPFSLPAFFFLLKLLVLFVINPSGTNLGKQSQKF